MYIQPHGKGDGQAYWADVDASPAAVVLVEVLVESVPEPHGDQWHPLVFSTLARAQAHLADRRIEEAVVSVRIIDVPDYGEGPDV